jgi:glycosyltransferase involved in cell wall biosynthesis
MDDLVSVIVPVYNVEKYLDKCIQSIIGQTYSKLEIILIDDGSSDSSSKILDSYKKKDSRIKVVRQENAGLSAARNTGIDNATGDYFVFVDSDDFISPHMVEILYDNLRTYNADISICGLHWVNEGESVEECLENDILVYDGRDVLRKLIGDDVISVVAWNKLYKASIFQKIRYPVGRLHEDEFVIHKILAKCKRSVYTKAKLYYYVRRAESISNNISAKNVIDAELAMSQRLVWSINVGDRKFSNWCFDNMLSVGYHAIRTFAPSEREGVHYKVRCFIKQALKKATKDRAIDWRRVIIGYSWLVSPRLSSRIRWGLFLFHN